jgi:UMF1 family MFS transporter
MTAAPEDRPVASRRARFGWALFDWAGNGFATVIVSFVFSAYFARAVAEDATVGTSQWGTAMAASGVAAALTAPLAGSIADQGGALKPWLALSFGLCAGATAALWFVEPTTAHVLLALVLVGIGAYAFELSQVFYNSLLPRLVPPQRMGRLSGRAWALGYAGGLACLVLVLALFVRVEDPALGLPTRDDANVRIVGPVVGAWLLVFALPLFLFTPDRARVAQSFCEMVGGGARRLKRTVSRVRRYRNLTRFLIARMVYTDGLSTLFAFGGVYAAGTFDMSVREVLLLGIALNVSAGLGATAGGWIDDRIGAKRTVLGALAGLMAFGLPILFVADIVLFWILAVALGLFMGPAQASSRSLMARLTPADMESEMFGFFAASGRIIAFAGPALVAWTTDLFDSQRAGISVILAFYLVGFLLLLPVKERRDA